MGNTCGGVSNKEHEFVISSIEQIKREMEQDREEIKFLKEE